MNKREAKKRALFHAHLVLDSYIREGSETLYNNYPEADADKISIELDKIAQRLFERSKDFGSGDTR